MVAENVTFALLVEVLSEQVSRPVIDRTGLTGTYGFTLEGTPEEQEPRNDADQRAIGRLSEAIDIYCHSRATGPSLGSGTRTGSIHHNPTSAFRKLSRLSILSPQSHAAVDDRQESGVSCLSNRLSVEVTSRVPEDRLLGNQGVVSSNAISGQSTSGRRSDRGWSGLLQR